MQGKYSQFSTTKQLLFLVLFLSLGIVVTVILTGIIISSFFGSEVLANSTALMSDGHAMRVMQIIQTFGFLFLPSAMFFWLFADIKDIKLFDSTNSRYVIISIALMLFAQLIISWLAYVNYQLVLPEYMAGIQKWMVQSEKEMAELTFIFLDTKHIPTIALNVFIMVLMPAVCEELLFRGIIQNKLTRWWNNPHLAILFTAILFSAIHMQFLTFLPRFFLGGLLGYLFYYGNSIWLPMAAHFTNNLGALVLFYYMRYQHPDKNPLDVDFTDLPSWWLVVAATIILVAGLIYIKRNSNEELVVG